METVFEDSFFGLNMKINGNDNGSNFYTIKIPYYY